MHHQTRFSYYDQDENINACLIISVAGVLFMITLISIYSFLGEQFNEKVKHIILLMSLILFARSENLMCVFKSGSQIAGRWLCVYRCLVSGLLLTRWWTKKGIIVKKFAHFQGLFLFFILCTQTNFVEACGHIYHSFPVYIFVFILFNCVGAKMLLNRQTVLADHFIKLTRSFNWFKVKSYLSVIFIPIFR